MKLKTQKGIKNMRSLSPIDRSTNSLIVLAIIFLSVGCMKKPDHTPNYGPETAQSDIYSSLSNLVKPDIFSIQQNNFTYVEDTLSISTGGPEVTNQEGITITARYEDDSVFLVEGIRQYVKLTQSGYTSSKKAFTVGANKTEVASSSTSVSPLSVIPYVTETLLSQTISNTNNPLKSLVSQLKPMSLNSTLKTSESPTKITFHNLKETDVQIPVPFLVRNRPNCGGLSDCNFIQAKKLEFDQVRWTSATQGDRTRFRYIISGEIPPVMSFDDSSGDFMVTNELLACQQLWMDYQGQTVPITQCRELKDFNIGTATQQ